MIQKLGVRILKERIRNFNYTVKKLNKCCDENGGTCDNCPNLKECVDLFDQRCEKKEGSQKILEGDGKMPQGKCNQCESKYYGWALLQEKYQACKCGGRIIVEGAKTND